MTRALIIGATSSLASALCDQLARQGTELTLAGRNLQELQRLADDLTLRHSIATRCIPLDVTQPDASIATLQPLLAETDQLYLASGDLGEEALEDPSRVAEVLEVNFTRPAMILAYAADSFAARGHGSLIVIGSVAGDRGRKKNYPYGSAKAGLAAFASGLRQKLHGSGVHVLTVKPGFIDTPMTYGMQSPLIASREKVARDIIKAVKHRKDILYTPWFWNIIMLIICHLPERIFKRTSI